MKRLSLIKKLSLFLILLLITASVISGCAKSSKTASNNAGPGKPDYDYSYDDSWGSGSSGADYPAEEPMPQPTSAPGEDGFYPPDAGKDIATGIDINAEMGNKIIKSGFMSLETLKFDETTGSVKRRVEQAGGFIASSNIQGSSKNYSGNKPMRRANFKVRIPSDKFEQFMTDVGSLGNVTRDESWGEDVSAQYFDTEARLESLTIQEDRLLEILSKAVKLSDIIELEREISNVRYQIENLTGTLRKWDNLVAFSTLEIEIIEVEEIVKEEVKPVTLWEKIASGFKNSLKAVVNILEFMLIFLISALPFLVLFGIIGLVVYFIVKLVLKKHDSNQG